MTRLYEKNKLTFALVCIAAYVVLMSLADGLSQQLGVEKFVTAPVAAAFAALLMLWILRRGLGEELGLGHIVNLFNGAALLPTLLQLVYACAVGFMFTVLFYKSGSLWPCIITHGVLNALSAFAVEGTDAADMLTAAALTVISVLYALWILKHGADKTE